MPKKQRRELSKEEQSMIVNAAQMRMPREKIALILGMSEQELRRHLKRDAALRDKVKRAGPLAGLKVRNSLFDLATGRKPVIERTLDPETGKWEERVVIKGRDPDPNMVKFYLHTQEGFKTVERHEHTGADGAPIEQKIAVEDRMPTREELEAELAAIQSRLIGKVKGEA